MDKYICKICKQDVKAENHYWREHQIKQMDYYQKFDPRYSKQTGELIKFKSKEFYLNNDFNDKREFAAWLKENPSEGRDYVVKLLLKRKEAGKIIYAPSSVELSSLMMPSMKWFKQNFQSYNNLCASLGLLPKFDIEDGVIEFKDLKKEAKIITDTREQVPFRFTGHDVLFKCLKYGDYALEPNNFKVHIERKELKDFIATIGVNYDRFSREIIRAKRDKAYLIVLVESPFNNILSFDHIPYIKRVTRVTPDFITHNMRKIMQTYNNIQFLFCNNKEEAKDMVLKIFGMKKHPKHFDLKYYKDIGKL